eukprot:TRINITY_DN1675_c0_g1_i1.p1 TRINITY_DN1675_c0_g1~~TRINITY_DN1675_c0_g1_i1.p1  ORF type:complete len:606 (-),score=127.95 TRINITY_DN1675_c0_g1_i1:20-1786(-)
MATIQVAVTDPYLQVATDDPYGVVEEDDDLLDETPQTDFESLRCEAPVEHFEISQIEEVVECQFDGVDGEEDVQQNEESSTVCDNSGAQIDDEQVEEALFFTDEVGEASALEGVESPASVNVILDDDDEVEIVREDIVENSTGVSHMSDEDSESDDDKEPRWPRVVIDKSEEAVKLVENAEVCSTFLDGLTGEDKDMDLAFPQYVPKLAQYLIGHPEGYQGKKRKGHKKGGGKRYFGGVERSEDVMADKVITGCWACGKLDHESSDCIFKRCFVCSVQGHEASECRERRKTCNRCFRPGHLIEDCPQIEYQSGLRSEDDLIYCRCSNCGEEGHLNCGAVPAVSCQSTGSVGPALVSSFSGFNSSGTSNGCNGFGGCSGGCNGYGGCSGGCNGYGGSSGGSCGGCNGYGGCSGYGGCGGFGGCGGCCGGCCGSCSGGCCGGCCGGFGCGGQGYGGCGGFGGCCGGCGCFGSSSSGCGGGQSWSDERVFKPPQPTGPPPREVFFENEDLDLQNSGQGRSDQRGWNNRGRPSERGWNDRRSDGDQSSRNSWGNGGGWNDRGGGRYGGDAGNRGWNDNRVDWDRNRSKRQRR